MACRRDIVIANRHLGIVELAESSAEFAARSSDLFECTGRWVKDTEDPELQRTFSEACHRHAWHARVWSDRIPAIPPIDPRQLIEAHRATLVDIDEDHDHDDVARTERYRRRLMTLVDRLSELESRITPELDPGTVRSIVLTRTDVVDLVSRLPSR